MTRRRACLAAAADLPQADLPQQFAPQMETHRSWLRLVLLAPAALCAGLGAAVAFAAPPAAPSAQSTIEKFLQDQTTGLPGRVSISVGSPGSGSLPACAALEAFLPQGAVPWGRVSVGLRCSKERPWTRFVPAHVAVEGTYFISARPIAAGQAFAAADVLERTGDLTALPRSIITEASALQGAVAATGIGPGVPMRRELLRGATVIQQGQTVRLVAQGAGFVLSTEGKAITQAQAGATVQVKTADGRLVRGVAGADGQVKLLP